MSIDDPKLKEPERHVSQLGEHYDSVRIVATAHHDGDPYSHSFGAGNYYALYGAIIEWLQNRDEASRQSCTPKMEDGDE